MEQNIIYVTKKDLQRIMHILSFQNAEDFENLEMELERAKIISDEEVPPDLITMNSKVKFLNVQDNKEMTITIVYPSDANFIDGKVSILASLGSALIGLKVGQQIDWEFPNGKIKTLLIKEILYQPEANGDWHL